MSVLESISTARLNTTDLGSIYVSQLNLSGIPSSGLYDIRREIASFLSSSDLLSPSIEQLMVNYNYNTEVNKKVYIANDAYCQVYTVFNLNSPRVSNPYISGNVFGFYGISGTGYPYNCLIAVKDISNNPPHDAIILVYSSNAANCVAGDDYRNISVDNTHLNSSLDWVDFDAVNTYPITYRPTNCSFPGAPTEAAIGETVVVPVTFPDGYGIVNNENVYVTNNGVVVPSTYSEGVLTFEMPDPS